MEAVPQQTLSNYEKHEHTINDKSFGRLKGSILVMDIKLRKDVDIASQTSQFVKTKVFIDGPVRKFSMFIKKHKCSPEIALLKTKGFISPYENSILKVEIQNPTHNDLR